MWDIWCIGDYKFLAAVLNSIAAWVGTGEPKQVAAIGMLISFIILGFQGVTKAGQMPQFQNILVGWIVFAILFGPGVTVAVKDSYSVNVEIVDNVPFGMAAAGSILSNIAHQLTASMETAFALPNMTEDGFGSALVLLLRQRENDLGPANFSVDGATGAKVGDLQRTLANYVKDCTMVGIQRGEKKESDIFTQTDHLASIFWASDVFYTKTYLPLDATEGAGITRTCNQSYNAISNYMSSPTFWSGWGPYLDSLLGPNSVNQTQLALDSIVGVGRDAQDYMLAALYRDVYELALRQGQIDSNDVTGIIVTTSAKEQRNVQWAAESSLFVSVVRPMMTFFEAFVYAVTPFMAFLVVLAPVGLSLAAKYCMTAIWVQLWMPVMAILNFYINFIAQKKLSSMDGQYDITSIAGMMQANTNLADWMSTAGMLAASTPLLTMALVYGGAVSATALAQRLTGRDHINEKAVAPDMLSQGASVGMQHNTWDTTSGLRAAGTEGMMKNISFGDDLQASTASGRSKVESSTLALGETLSQTLGSSGHWSKTGGLSQTARDSLLSSGTETSSVAQKYADSINKSLGDEKVDSSKLEGALVGGFGAGLGKLTGEALKADMHGRLSSVFSEGETNKIMNQLGNMKMFEEGSSNRAEMVQAMANDVTKTHGTENSLTKDVANQQNLSRKAENLERDSQEFKESQSRSAHYGSETSMPLNTLAHQAVQNGALPALDNAMERVNAVDGTANNERDMLAKRYQENNHMDYPTARSAANLDLLDRYGNRGGKLGDIAREGLVPAIDTALGRSMSQAVQTDTSRSNGNLAPGAMPAAKESAGKVVGTDLKEGIPSSAPNLRKDIGNGLNNAEESAGNRNAVKNNYEGEKSKIDGRATKGHAEMAAGYKDHYRDQLAEQVYNPNLGHTHTNKANGLLTGVRDVTGQTQASLMAMAHGGLGGAREGAKDRYEQALAGVAEADGLKGKLAALLDIPLGTAEGFLQGGISGAGNALALNYDAFYDNEKEIGLKHGLNDEQASLYAVARTDLASRLASSFGAEGENALGFAAGQTTDQFENWIGDKLNTLTGGFTEGGNFGLAQEYGYGVDLPGNNTDLKRDAILMAAHSSTTGLLDQVSELNRLDGTPSFGFFDKNPSHGNSGPSNPELLTPKPPKGSEY